MKMRNIIPLVTGGTLLATLFGSSTLHAATKSKPNLVLVLVDDMGWGAFAPNHVDFTEKELNQEFCRIHVQENRDVFHPSPFHYDTFQKPRSHSHNLS